MNKAQWITICIGVLVVAALFLFGRTGPYKSGTAKNFQSSPQSELTVDSILFHAKEILTPAQIQWMNDLEQSVIRGDVKKQKLDVFHQLAHFWKIQPGSSNLMPGMKQKRQDWKIQKNHSPLLPI